MKRSLFLLLLLMALVVAACSGDDEGAGTTTTTSTAGGTTTTQAEGSDDTTTSEAVTSTSEAEDAITTTSGDGSATTTTSGPADTTTTTEPTDDDDATTTSLVLSGDFPVTVVSDAGPTTIDVPPLRIAALSPTHVEILYALGAGDRIIAVDLFSNFPAAASGKKQLDAFNLSVEEVIATDPDLVVLTFDPVGAVDALESVGIPTLLLGTATTLESAYLQMGVLGSATGLEAESDALVEEVASGIAAAVASAGSDGSGLTYYHESDPFTFYTPTSLSFIGQIYDLFGMENIADAAPDAAGQTFPQLSPEFIVGADPELIFSTDPAGDISVYTERDGWGSMSAVANGDVYFLDADVASRWGPRLVELVEAIAAAIEDHTT